MLALKILDYIKQYSEQYGYSPTYLEIAQGVGIKSTEPVAYHLNKLEDSGQIKKKRRSPRSIKVLKD